MIGQNALGCAVALALSFGGAVMPATAQSVIDQWAVVQTPPAPVLRSVTVDPRTTALLVLDFNGAQDPARGPCSARARPRCIASLPRMKTLLEAARSHGVFVVYSTSTNGTPGDIAMAIAPLPGDPVVKSGPDKFVGTHLRELLTGKGIKTIIVTGTGAEGAVLDTSTDAVLREKLKVIVPVDGMSSASLFPEQYVAWHLANASGLVGNVTLSRTDMIHF